MHAFRVGRLVFVNKLSRKNRECVQTAHRADLRCFFFLPFVNVVDARVFVFARARRYIRVYLQIARLARVCAFYSNLQTLHADVQAAAQHSPVRNAYSRVTRGK